MRTGLAAVVAVGALAAVPSAAAARTYSAYAGNPGKVPSSAPPSTQLNKFFPATLKVRAGDKVKYASGFIHTASVLGRGVARPPLALPDPSGAKYPTLNDAAGQPFSTWAGKPKFIYNPAAFLPVVSSTVNDRKTHSSGVIPPAANGGPGTFTMRFAKPGTYRVVCLVHPGMTQTVKVLKKKAKGADSTAKVRSEVVKQSNKGYGDAATAAGTKVPPATIYAGVERKQATLIAFLPDKLTVPSGTTVNFVLHAPSEVHNEVFGPDAYVDNFSSTQDLLPFAPGQNQFAPPFVFGSDPPGADGAYTYNGANHGNGFFWSPVMDDQPGDPPNGLPGSEKITFTAPGTYTFFCGIHGRSMKGTVVVTG